MVTSEECIRYNESQRKENLQKHVWKNFQYYYLNEDNEET